MSKKMGIKKLVLETKDGKHIELTIEEAKELHKQLDSLFASRLNLFPIAPVVIERDRWNPPYQQFWYNEPNISNEPRFGGLDVQCSISGDSGMSVSYCGQEL